MGLSPFLFLSYRSLERGFASRLSADLKNAGVGLWMDSLDIKPGEDWDRSIESAMDRCTAVVAIISPAYVTSDVCRAELGRAHALGRPVFPVLLEAVAAAQWPLLLQNRQYVDFTGRRDDAAYEAGFSELLTALHERFGGIDGATPDPERRYLNALLAELEAARGVLEYLPLDTVTAAGTPHHVSPDEWAFDVLLDVGTSTPEQHTTKLSSVEDLLRQGGNVALLGDAGAGKTTTLRWIARRAALMRAAEPRTRPLPVLGYLGQWPGDRSVEEFLGDLCPVLPSAEALDPGSDMIILLDGLNEMGAEASGRIDELRRWLGTRPANWSVIVTCRSADFAALELPGLTTATLRELDDDRIRRFAARYLLALEILPTGDRCSRSDRPQSRAPDHSAARRSRRRSPRKGGLRPGAHRQRDSRRGAAAPVRRPVGGRAHQAGERTPGHRRQARSHDTVSSAVRRVSVRSRGCPAGDDHPWRAGKFRRGQRDAGRP